jgi:hypothetical protein
MKEVLSSSETLVLTRATRRNIPEDTILHSHRRDNLKSYTEAPGSYATLQNINQTTRSHIVILLSTVVGRLDFPRKPLIRQEAKPNSMVVSTTSQ